MEKNEVIRKIWKCFTPGNLKQTQIKMKTQWNVKQIKMKTQWNVKPDHQDHNIYWNE